MAAPLTNDLKISALPGEIHLNPLDSAPAAIIAPNRKQIPTIWTRIDSIAHPEIVFEPGRLHIHRFDNLARPFGLMTNILIKRIGIVDFISLPEPLIRPSGEDARTRYLAILELSRQCLVGT